MGPELFTTMMLIWVVIYAYVLYKITTPTKKNYSHFLVGLLLSPFVYFALVYLILISVFTFISSLRAKRVS